MRRPLVAVLASAAVLVPFAVVGWLTSPASATGAGPHGISGITDTVVDPVHAHVFTSDTVTGSVKVYDTGGTLIRTFGGLVDPSAMVITPDSSTVYVAVNGEDGIEQIDTSTFASSLISTGAQSCPSSLAVDEGMLWFTYGCGEAQLGAMNLSSGAMTFGLAKNAGIGDEPEMLASPTLPGTPVIGERDGSPGRLHDILVTGGDQPSARQGHSVTVTGTIGGMAVSADGAKVYVVHGGASVGVYDTSSLQSLDGYPAGAGNQFTGVAVRADGMLAISGLRGGQWGFNVYQPGSHTVYRRYDGLVGTNSMAFGVLKVFAVIDGVFRAIVPKHLTTLTIHANHSHVAENGLVTLTAHLGSTFSNRTVSVYATPYQRPRHLVRTGRVNAAGNLVVSVHVTQRTTYSATFAGDSQSSPASGSTIVTAAARVGDALQGFYGSAGMYRLYHTTQDPIEDATVAPNRAGMCVWFHLQFHVNGVWGYDESTKCIHLSSSSQAGVRLTGNPPAGEEIRIRAEWHGNVYNTRANGLWRYLRFTN